MNRSSPTRAASGEEPGPSREAPALVSVVVPCFNEEGNIAPLYEALRASLEGWNWELVMVDDGSADGTYARILELARTDRRLRGFRLSRNFGHQSALLAGISASRGDVLVTMDSDLQHPPDLIPRLIAEWMRGFNIVHTRRMSEGQLGWFKRVSSSLYYRMFSLLSGVRVEDGASDFRLMDRRVVRALLSMQEAQLFLRGLVVWMGYRNTVVPYTVRPRYSGSTKFGLGKMIRFAFAGITSFSTIPLRLGIALGFLTSAAAFLEIVYVIWAKAQGHVVPGWASMTALLSFLFGCSFVLIGLLGIYVGHIFKRVQHHPSFFVEETTEESDPAGVVGEDRDTVAKSR